MGDAWYLDASAIVKTVVQEDASAALMRWLASRSPLVSSDLSRVEVLRAVRRVEPAALPRARQVLAALTLIRLDDALLDAAAELREPSLRALDAVHLAAAVAVGDDLAGLVTYDQGMAEAARNLGLRVASPA